MTDFVRLIHRMRSEMGLGEFTGDITRITKFNRIVDFIDNVTRGLEATLQASKESDEKISKVEEPPEYTIWRKYFADHTFSDLENQKNISDMLTALTGIPMSKFIRISNPKQLKFKFPAFVVIIPTGNSNSHSYDLGEMIISLSNGTQFYKVNGESGNTMSSDPLDFIFPSRDEITSFLARFIYNFSPAAEHFEDNLLPG